MEQASQLPPPAAEPARSITTVSALAVAGGALVALGSIMPWAKVSVLDFLSVSVRGTEGDGWISLGLGVLLALVGVVGLVRGRFVRVAALVLGLGSLALAVYEMTQVSGALDDLGAEAAGVAHVSMGIGLWILLIGGVIGVVSGVLRPSSS
jgi:hypothetical protein